MLAARVGGPSARARAISSRITLLIASTLPSEGCCSSDWVSGAALLTGREPDGRETARAFPLLDFGIAVSSKRSVLVVHTEVAGREIANSKRRVPVVNSALVARGK